MKSTTSLIFIIWPLLLPIKSHGLELNIDPASVEFYAEDYPPANFYENQELKGLSVDTLRLMWQALDIKPKKIAIVPWARGYKNVLNQPNSALFTMSRTPARERLFKWVGPLFSSVHILVAKKSRHFQFDHVSQVVEYRVATVRGDISQILLQQIGFPEVNMAKLPDLRTAFLMMQSDRVEMMIVSVHGFKHLLEQMGVDEGGYEQVLFLNKSSNYIAFNKSTSDTVVAAYQSALDGLGRVRDEIKTKYGLPNLEY
jgi:polar amino acid transport system substrate-binding protein